MGRQIPMVPRQSKAELFSRLDSLLQCTPSIAVAMAVARSSSAMHLRPLSSSSSSSSVEETPTLPLAVLTDATPEISLPFDIPPAIGGNANASERVRGDARSDRSQRAVGSQGSHITRCSQRTAGSQSSHRVLVADDVRSECAPFSDTASHVHPAEGYDAEARAAEELASQSSASGRPSRAFLPSSAADAIVEDDDDDDDSDDAVGSDSSRDHRSKGIDAPNGEIWDARNSYDGGGEKKGAKKGGVESAAERSPLETDRKTERDEMEDDPLEAETQVQSVLESEVDHIEEVMSLGSPPLSVPVSQGVEGGPCLRRRRSQRISSNAHNGSSFSTSPQQRRGGGGSSNDSLPPLSALATIDATLRHIMPRDIETAKGGDVVSINHQTVARDGAGKGEGKRKRKESEGLLKALRFARSERGMKVWGEYERSVLNFAAMRGGWHVPEGLRGPPDGLAPLPAFLVREAARLCGDK